MYECRCGCGRPAPNGAQSRRGLSIRCYQRLWRRGDLDRFPPLGRPGRAPGDGQGHRGGGRGADAGPRPPAREVPTLPPCRRCGRRLPWKSTVRQLCGNCCNWCSRHGRLNAFPPVTPPPPPDAPKRVDGTGRLTPAWRAAIRAALQAHYSQAAIARAYDVSKLCVWRIAQEGLYAEA